MSEITLDEQAQKLESYEKGFLALHLVNTGVELGLFDKIKAHDTGLSPEMLSQDLGLHAPFVRIWCQTAYFMEILDCDNAGRFRLAPHMDALLTDTTNPYYFGHRARFMVTHSAEDLRRQPAYFKSGSTYFYDAHSQQFSRDAKALTSHIVPLAYMFMILPSLPGLRERLQAGVKCLDVGCGAGALMIQLARSFPNSQFIGIEVDQFAVEDAQRFLKGSEVEDRVSALLLSAASMDYDREFELVNMAFALHEIAPDIKRRSLANCHRALRDSGQIVVLDFSYPEKQGDFRNPQYATGIKDQFQEVIWGSEHLPLVLKHQLLLEAGFRDPSTLPLFGGLIEVTCATK